MSVQFVIGMIVVPIHLSRHQFLIKPFPPSLTIIRSTPADDDNDDDSDKENERTVLIGTSII